MKTPRVAFAAKVAMIASAAIAVALIINTGCGPGGTYLLGGGTGGAGGRIDSTGSGGGGFAGAPGTGGMIAGTGGDPSPGSGGSAEGGRNASGGSSGGGAGGAAASGGGGGTGSGGRGGGGGGGGLSAGTGGVMASGGAMGTGGMALGGRTGGGGAVSSGGTTGSGGAAGGGGRGGATGSGGMGGAGGGTSGSGGSNWRILSLDFVGARVTGFGGAGGKTVTPLPSMASTEVAGVKPAANWNSASGAASTGSGLTPLLLDNGSTAGSAVITWNAPTTATSPGVYSAGLTDEPGDVRMLNGYLDPAGGTPPAATITVTGLPAPFTTSAYDVYVYFLASLGEGQTRSHQFTLTTPAPGNYNMSVTVSQTGPTMPFSGYSLATATTGNYVVFKNVTGSRFSLTSTAVMSNTSALRAPVNGFQVVWPAGS